MPMTGHSKVSSSSSSQPSFFYHKQTNAKIKTIMPKKGATKSHHCPGKRKGNCRRNQKKGYCTAHQTICKKHNYVHLIGEPCSYCENGKGK